MTSVFLHGPLGRDSIVARIAGISDIAPAPETATVQGFALRSASQHPLPGLQPAKNDCVQGVLVALEGAALNRLTYLCIGLGWSDRTATISNKNRTLSAIIYVDETNNGEAAFDGSDWAQSWSEIAEFALIEIFEHFGRVSAERLRRMMPMIWVRAAARKAAKAPVPTAVRSAARADAVKVEKNEATHAGFFLTRSYTLKHPTFAGEMSPPVQREVFVATDAAIVLPYDPVRDRVLLVEQFRMGPFGRGDPHPWMLEPVAGRVDPGETPAETARRECVEEAGLSLGRLEHVSSHYCSLGCSTEYFHCFVGLCDLPELSKGQGGLDSEDEDIRTHVLSFEQAVALIPSGEAANGPLVVCLLWLERERERLRRSA